MPGENISMDIHLCVARPICFSPSMPATPFVPPSLCIQAYDRINIKSPMPLEKTRRAFRSDTGTIVRRSFLLRNLFHIAAS